MIIRTTNPVVGETFAAVARKSDRFGRSKSLKWPWLYDKLRAKGYDKSKAAAISNARIPMRKGGRLNVLPAAQAHKSSVLGKLAAADKAGKYSTESQLTGRKRRRSITATAYADGRVEFACHSKACAPPPAGVGGSTKGGVTSTTPERTFPIIKASEARGDSRPVSHEEFQKLARVGQGQLDGFKARSSAAKGLDDNWGKIKEESYAEATKSWGGATIDAHTGKALPQGSNKYAITVKDQHTNTVSVPEKATRQEFDVAMDVAKERFRGILERESHYLGVFHDDDMGRIDIDPVLVVSKRADVDTIGSAARSIGGAYNFSDGNGYWPPHVEGS